MAKRRDRPVGNPLRTDFVDGLVQVSPLLAEPRPAPKIAQEPRRPTKTTKRPENVEKADPPQRREPRAETRIQIKARFDASEAAEIERFTRTLSRYVGSKIKTAEVTRALWRLAIRSEDQLAELSAKAPNSPRPSYGSSFDMAGYQDEITEFLLLALKNTPKAGR